MLYRRHRLTLYAELLERPAKNVSIVHLSHTKQFNLQALTLLNLVRLNVPQLVDLRSLASDNALGELNSAANSSAPADSVLCSLAGDLDKADARILGTAVVLAVTEVAEPCLEGGGVVLFDAGAVGLDGSGARDGGPLAGVVEEGEVDVGVLGEVVGLAGLGVGVEDEVDAVVLLWGGVSSCCVSS